MRDRGETKREKDRQGETTKDNYRQRRDKETKSFDFVDHDVEKAMIERKKKRKIERQSQTKGDKERQKKRQRATRRDKEETKRQGPLMSSIMMLRRRRRSMNPTAM